MKLRCGPTGAAKRRRAKMWHPWFAWRPVRLNHGGCRWWEWLERKEVVNYYGFPVFSLCSHHYVEYRVPENKLWRKA